MLSYFFRQLVSSFGIFFRTIRAFFTRRLTGLGARLRRMTNFSRQATRVASQSFQGAAAAVKKPSKREDYIETHRLFISKSFLILLSIGIVALGCLIYFVIWPFLLSHFFTAHLYQGDSDLTDWSGRVIVYYDEKKKQPMYAGTLEDGLLQGRGTEYDEAGLISYEGYFVDGEKNGSGKLFENGVLRYDGDFLDDLYDGDGTLYEDGTVVYEGSFVSGLADGMGTAYSPEGILIYKGSFSEGVYDGTGTTYYETGARSYVGAFVAGLREGEGTEYREDGSILYKGFFAEDLYEGSGTYYLEDAQGTIQANFTDGVTDGAIQWYKNGKLWYDGAADNLTPNGYGTIYARSGKAIYAGEMDRGTIDGVWLMGLTSAEIRAVFADATLTELAYSGGGFLIINKELGLWVQCSYQQEDAEAAVHSLWLAVDKAEEHMTSLIPWTSQSAFDDWVQAGNYIGVHNQQIETIVLPDGLYSGSWAINSYVCDGWTFSALSASSEAGPEILCWVSEEEISSEALDTLLSGAADSSVQENMDSLLEMLELVEVSGAGPATISGDVSRLIGLTQSAEDAQTLVSALLDYYEYTQIQSTLDESKPLLQQLLSEEITQVARGTGSQTTVDSLQAEINDITLRQSQCKANLNQAALTIQELTMLEPTDYDLSGLLYFFDSTELDVTALCQAAVDYAAAVAAGRYDVDDTLIINQCKMAVINLEVSCNNVESAHSNLELAIENVTAMTQDYARGTADKYSLYHTQCAQNEAIADLYTALCAFMKQVSSLNTLSGGWLTEEFGWLEDVYPAIFQSEIARGEEEAAIIQAEREQREQSAEEQLTENKTDNTSEESEGSTPEGAAE
ncbi:MAG: hypothetical protein LUC21_07200 [Oscillospiraceae bacterium]|nr:hypothetical protein [Oscillospiraceae bacterium]